MYEVDFTGWTRTPEAIAELKRSWWKRLGFHFRRVRKADCWWRFFAAFRDLIRNTKNI